MMRNVCFPTALNRVRVASLNFGPKRMLSMISLAGLDSKLPLGILSFAERSYSSGVGKDNSIKPLEAKPKSRNGTVIPNSKSRTFKPPTSTGSKETTSEGAKIPQLPRKTYYEGMAKMCLECRFNDVAFFQAGTEFLKRVQPIVINGQEVLGKYNVARIKGAERPEKLDRFLARAVKTGDSRLCLIIFNHLISIYGKRGNCPLAQLVFDSMLLNRIKPDSQTYNVLLEAYAFGGEVDKAAETHELIKTTGFRVTRCAHLALIRVYIKHNQLNRAVAVLESLEDNKLDLWVEDFNELMRKFSLAKDHSQVRNTFAIMKAHGKRPNPTTFAILVTAIPKNDISEALAIFQEFISLKAALLNTAFNKLLVILSSHPESYASSVQLLDRMDSKLTPSNLLTLMKAAHTWRSLSDSRRFFHALLQCEVKDDEMRTAMFLLLETYATPSVVDATLRSMPSFEPESNLDFLNNPVPTNMTDCIKEVTALFPTLDKIPFEKGAMYQSQLPWKALLNFFINHNYLDEAVRYFEILLAKSTDPLGPHIYISMLKLCYRVHHEENFALILQNAKALLAPIHHTSCLTSNEKTLYMKNNLISSDHLIDLCTSAIMGLIEFNQLDSALDYFHFLVQDTASTPEIQQSLYTPLLKKIQASGDDSLQQRLAKNFMPQTNIE